MNDHKKILVVGSLNMDVLVKADEKPSRGQSVLGSHFGLYPGGKGANQAVQAARLGAEVIMFGRVGEDMFGEQLVNSLQQAGVIVDHIRKDAQDGTGMGCVFGDKHGDNWIVVVPRANMNWQTEDTAMLPQLLEQCGMVVIQLEIPMPIVVETVTRAHEMNIPVMLNPAPALDIPAGLLKKIDILIPNESEAEFYTGIKIADIESAKKAALELCKRGAARVIVTLGKNGAVLCEGGHACHYAAYSVEAQDATAAGDAFCGALAVAILKGQAMDAAMAFAGAAGAFCATRLGAQPSLGTLAEIQTFMDTHSL